MYLAVLEWTGSNNELNQQVFYDENPDSFGTKLLDPVLELEENTAGSFKAVVPHVNYLYDFVIPNDDLSGTFKQFASSELIIYGSYGNVTYEMWRGRPVKGQADTFNQQTVEFEGELSYLNDTLQLGYTFVNNTPSEIFSTLLMFHNSKVDEKYQFLPGDCTVTEDTSLYQLGLRKSTEGFSASMGDHTLDCIKRLLSTYGGYLQITRDENGVRYLNWYAEKDRQTSGNVSFGYNLVDYASEWDFSDIITVLLPIGQTYSTSDNTDESHTCLLSDISGHDEYLTILECADTAGKYDNVWTAFGRREECVTFDHVVNPSILYNYAKKYLTDIQFDGMLLAVTALDFVALGLVEPNEELPLIFQTNIHATADPYGLDRDFPVTKMTVRLNKPEDNLYTMTSNASSKRTSISTTLWDHEERQKQIEQKTDELEYDITDKYDRLTKKVSSYMMADAGDMSDWIMGIIHLAYPEDEAMSDILPISANMTRCFVPGSDYFVGPDSYGYYRWFDAIKGVSYTPSGEYDLTRCGTILLVSGSIDTNNTKPTANDAVMIPSPKALDSLTDLRHRGQRLTFSLGGALDDSKSYAVYVVAYFPTDLAGGSSVYSNTAKIGHTSSYINLDADGYLCANGTRLIDENSANIPGLGVPLVFVFMRNVVAGKDNAYMSNFIIGRKTGVTNPTNGSGLVSNQATMEFNYLVNEEFENFEDRNHYRQIGLYCMAVTEGAPGQINMDEVVTNTQGLIDRYLSDKKE